ncbi:DUF4097 domain-containing protein [Haloferax larsenii]|uniref:DUF4097 domain-containing protein n=1 Tax=Haloferax larsenii TaxID=302484 RepID=A0ABY5RDV2_HALLR|nr:DUF4097 family beta strand repeat-containing protein [Haloferax larsenii]ELZ84313.1 hypothetical protein C455_01382 [Haloferax larsenii JCM 13917]UVE49218.1 DUF4097 domain-containing protein [Haloferax larsenii]
MRKPSRRSFLTGGATLGLASLAGCTAPSIETREAETRVVSPDGFESLEVRNRNGTVTIEPWEQNDVEVRVVKRGFVTEDLDSVRVDIGGDESLTVERVVRGDDPEPVVVELEIRVPSAFPVSHASTSNGSVDVRRTAGDLEVQTTNGDIDVQRVDGFVDATASNGSVSARGVAGLDGVRTTNGSITVDVFSIRSDTSIETSNGEIDAALASDLDAELVAQTSTESIDVSGLSLADASISRTHVDGTLGDGGPTLTVLTSNGRIELSLLGE